MKIYFWLYFFISMLLLASCQSSNESANQASTAGSPSADTPHHGQANEHMNDTPFDSLVARFESKERASWQFPDEILKQMGDLTSKRIMDLGAGTGYFAFSLSETGAQVIAADVDERFLDFMRQRKEALNIPDEEMEVRKVPYDDPLLKAEEVDIFFSVNVYHHIENRVEYFKKVKDGLVANGKVFIVDFKKQETSHGPPLEMRVSGPTIAQELKEAGFESVDLRSQVLPEQNIIIAYKKAE